MAKRSSPILRRWRITEMESWDRDVIDMEVKAYIEFDAKGGGEFQFCLVHGWIDYRLTQREGKPAVEWSWDGNDETDEASGRGWAVLERPGKLAGEILIHHGEESGFVAKPFGSRK